MKTWSRILWWVTYIIGAVILQQQIPGVDALVPGFLLSLQEKKTWQTAWLFLIFVLIQEGAGSLHFGGSLLWYGGQILLFQVSQRFFLADNLPFVLLLSLSLGAYRGIVTWFMCIVQGIPVEYVALVESSLLQAFLIPAIWGLACLTRPATAMQSN